MQLRPCAHILCILCLHCTMKSNNDALSVHAERLLPAWAGAFPRQQVLLRICLNGSFRPLHLCKPWERRRQLTGESLSTGMRPLRASTCFGVNSSFCTLCPSRP